MKQKSNQRKKRQKQSQATEEKQAPQSNYQKSMSRRSVLQNALLYTAGGAVVLGGAGWFVTRLQMQRQESRLQDIGTGTATVLQIHDPQCQLCLQLQRETRKAVNNFLKEDVQFRVANIRTEEGSAAAARYGVPHITLVLLDQAGAVAHVVRGVTPADELTEIFKRRLKLQPE